MRHYLEGYQSIIKNDVYHIEERLKEYCPDLSILYNPRTNKWRVMEGEWCVMNVPYPTLDDRTYWHMRRIDKFNDFNASEELRKSEEKMEKQREKEQQDMIREMSKDLKKAAWKE